MSKEIIVENIANGPKAIPGFPVFLPGEMYRFDIQHKEKLLNCPFIEEVVAAPKADLEPAEEAPAKKVVKSTVKKKK